MTILLDTSALIYWTIEPDALTQIARTTIESANRLLVSSISIWEIGIKVRKGNLRLHGSLDEFVTLLEQAERLELLPVTTDIWVKTVRLDWAHRDPADRVIVATAMLHGCPLVTSDRAMRQYYSHSVW